MTGQDGIGMINRRLHYPTEHLLIPSETLEMRLAVPSYASILYTSRRIYSETFQTSTWTTSSTISIATDIEP